MRRLKKIPSGEIRSIHDALRETLEGIDISFRPTLPAFRKDKVQTGRSRELSVKQLLESFFPTGWSVRKGPIHDKDGNVSAEVDCSLCVPDHPPCSTPNRQLILAEGVHAAIEVKPDISSLTEKGELKRSLEQCVSVKKLRRTILLAETPSQKTWPSEVHRIPYVIFAKKLPKLEKVIDFLDRQKIQNSWSAWDLPDVILGYDRGLIYHAPDISVCSLTPFLAKNGFTDGEGYLICPMGTDSIILFLSLLYGFISPRPLLSVPILKELLTPIAIPAGMEFFSVTNSATPP